MKIRDSYKIVFMGDASVGKSSIITQFIDGYFNAAYKPTIEDFHTHTVQLKSKSILFLRLLVFLKFVDFINKFNHSKSIDGFDHNVHILDCSGTHEFPAMRELSIRTGKGFVLVFALDSQSSFNETVELYKQIIRIRGTDTNVPIVLVGNKSDLVNKRVIDEKTISTRKLLEMNDLPYIETSAKLDRNIREVFQELLMLTLEQENRVQQNRKLQDKQQQAQIKKARNQQLLRRLSTSKCQISFGSLPNINLIRRKSNSTNNHSSNSSISECSSSSGTEDNSSSPKHVAKNKSTNVVQKPMFYSPIIKRKFNDNHVKPQLSLDETKIKNLNQRLMNSKIKISNTKSFDTASTTSSFTSSNSNSSTNSSIKGSKDSLKSLESKCQVM